MQTERMDQKVVLVSGGTSGVGFGAAKGLARLGARTMIISRREENALRAAAAIRQQAPDAEVDHVLGDLTDPVSVTGLVQQVAAKTDRLDVLVSGAGSVGEKGFTAGGLPRTFVTNYLGHYWLITGVLPLLQARRAGRILLVGVHPALIRALPEPRNWSVDPKSSVIGLTAQTVQWKLLLARHLAETMPDGPTMNVFHPGVVASGLFDSRGVIARSAARLFNSFARDDCPIVDHLASSSEVAGISGRAFDDHGRLIRAPKFVTADRAAAVWQASEGLTPKPS